MPDEKFLLQKNKDGIDFVYVVSDLLKKNMADIPGMVTAQAAFYPELAATSLSTRPLSLLQLAEDPYTDIPNIKLLLAIRRLQLDSPKNNTDFQEILQNTLRTAISEYMPERLTNEIAAQNKKLNFQGSKPKKNNNVITGLENIIKKHKDQLAALTTEIKKNKVTGTVDNDLKAIIKGKLYSVGLDQADILYNASFNGLGENLNSYMDNSTIAQLLKSDGCPVPKIAEIRGIRDDSKQAIIGEYIRQGIPTDKATFKDNHAPEFSEAIKNKLESYKTIHPNAKIKIDHFGNFMISTQGNEKWIPLLAPKDDDEYDTKIINAVNWPSLKQIHEMSVASLHELGLQNENIVTISIPVLNPNAKDGDQQNTLYTEIVDICTTFNDCTTYSNPDNYKLFREHIHVPEAMQTGKKAEDQTYMLQINNGGGHFVACVLKMDKTKKIVTASFKNSRDDYTGKTSIYIQPATKQLIISVSQAIFGSALITYKVPIIERQQTDVKNCGFWTVLNTFAMAKDIEIAKLDKDTDPNSGLNIRARILANNHPYSRTPAIVGSLKDTVATRRVDVLTATVDIKIKKIKAAKLKAEKADPTDAAKVVKIEAAKLKAEKAEKAATLKEARLDAEREVPTDAAKVVKIEEATKEKLAKLEAAEEELKVAEEELKAAEEELKAAEKNAEELRAAEADLKADAQQTTTENAGVLAGIWARIGSYFITKPKAEEDTSTPSQTLSALTTNTEDSTTKSNDHSKKPTNEQKVIQAQAKRKKTKKEKEKQAATKAATKIEEVKSEEKNKPVEAKRSWLEWLGFGPSTDKESKEQDPSSGDPNKSGNEAPKSISTEIDPVKEDINSSPAWLNKGAISEIKPSEDKLDTIPAPPNRPAPHPTEKEQIVKEDTDTDDKSKNVSTTVQPVKSTTEAVSTAEKVAMLTKTWNYFFPASKTKEPIPIGPDDTQNVATFKQDGSTSQTANATFSIDEMLDGFILALNPVDTKTGTKTGAQIGAHIKEVLENPDSSNVDKIKLYAFINEIEHKADSNEEEETMLAGLKSAPTVGALLDSIEKHPGNNDAITHINTLAGLTPEELTFIKEANTNHQTAKQQAAVDKAAKGWFSLLRLPSPTTTSVDQAQGKSVGSVNIDTPAKAGTNTSDSDGSSSEKGTDEKTAWSFTSIISGLGSIFYSASDKQGERNKDINELDHKPGEKLTTKSEPPPAKETSDTTPDVVNNKDQQPQPKVDPPKAGTTTSDLNNEPKIKKDVDNRSSSDTSSDKTKQPETRSTWYQSFTSFNWIPSFGNKQEGDSGSSTYKKILSGDNNSSNQGSKQINATIEPVDTATSQKGAPGAKKVSEGNGLFARWGQSLSWLLSKDSNKVIPESIDNEGLNSNPRVNTPKHMDEDYPDATEDNADKPPNINDKNVTTATLPTFDEIKAAYEATGVSEDKDKFYTKKIAAINKQYKDTPQGRIDAKAALNNAFGEFIATDKEAKKDLFAYADKLGINDDGIYSIQFLCGANILEKVELPVDKIDNTSVDGANDDSVEDTHNYKYQFVENKNLLKQYEKDSHENDMVKKKLTGFGKITDKIIIKRIYQYLDQITEQSIKDAGDEYKGNLPDFIHDGVPNNLKLTHTNLEHLRKLQHKASSVNAALPQADLPDAGGLGEEPNKVEQKNKISRIIKSEGKTGPDKSALDAHVDLVNQVKTRFSDEEQKKEIIIGDSRYKRLAQLRRVNLEDKPAEQTDNLTISMVQSTDGGAGHKTADAGATSFLDAVITATGSKKDSRQQALDDILKPAKYLQNEVKMTDPDIDSKFIIAANKMEYVKVDNSEEQIEKDIEYMVAKCAKDFQLEPIVISGGTYKQQAMAIVNALEKGFTNIEVTPPRKDKDNVANKSDEYVKLITLVKEVKEQYKYYADCLDDIADNSPENALSNVYNSVAESLDANNKYLYNEVTNNVGYPPPSIGGPN